ncbi:pyridine nucleotide-disulfide oxidoreductase [Virgibacillus sp. 7505]|uniref:NAD(P)/FAD-dependent oxidoreductase n=1 Tax=Virgibacillus sp. 7505 TaxID=2022548 RepID=UPI000BA678D3|nr:NAD(P)/FAD-dependent oxidoreductase [Virgibacillus sp. 7505]PAE18159.1 pyridine nucleotide-disulfide oxidoreductase [Virgibacillus sp. 7505]
MYDVIIIGGGIAGIQAAIQFGRYKRDVLVLDKRNDGRSHWCKSYHNLIGWPDGVSGNHLLELGRKQIDSYGCISIEQQEAVEVEKWKEGFTVKTADGNKHDAKLLLFSTGITDRIPIKELYPLLGTDVYVCPDCDGYEISGKRTVVAGSGEAGAHLAIMLHYWSDDIVFVNHEQEPVSEETFEKLKKHSIEYYDQPIQEVVLDDEDKLEGFLVNGEKLWAEKAFVAFGKNKVNSELAESLGVELHKNKHIENNPRTKETSVEGVWAAGDITVHSEQVSIAMGDGMQAAIWMQKRLLKTK